MTHSKTPANGESTPRRSTGVLSSAVERAARVAGRRMPSDGVISDDVVVARAALSVWLVEGRQAREMTREHVARVTRIPMRTLDSLEEGRWDELPADVFVRGFLRSYARCVGLSVEEALARYGGCGFTAAPVASAQAQALLDTMASLAPSTVAARPMSAAPVTTAPRILAAAEPPPAVAEPAALPALEVAPLDAAPARKRTTRQRAATVPGTRERDAKGRFVRKSVEMAAVVVPDEVRAEAEALDAADRAAASAPPVAPTPIEAVAAPASPVAAPVVEITPIVEATLAPVTAPLTAPMRVTPPRASRAFVAPSLVIDDDHPEDAERTREERARAKDGGWRSFLPPALLDQERGSRQGGLTLAVIILLIVATLTLSYLMRRPSSTGEGITRAATPAAELG